MALRLIREVSATPNISNRDDACMARYAYGGYDGIIQHIGEECMLTLQSSKMHVGSGRLVIQGWEVNVEPEDFEFSWVADPKQYTYLCVKIDLLLETASWMLVSTSNNTLDPYGDDLTQNSAGARVTPVYRWNSVDGSAVVFLLSSVPYAKEVNSAVQQQIKSLNDAFITQLGGHKIEFSENEVLKIDGQQISYRKLLWAGSLMIPARTSASVYPTLTSPIPREQNKLYELWFSFNNNYVSVILNPDSTLSIYATHSSVSDTLEAIYVRGIEIMWQDQTITVRSKSVFMHSLLGGEKVSISSDTSGSVQLVRIYEYKEEALNGV